MRPYNKQSQLSLFDFGGTIKNEIMEEENFYVILRNRSYRHETSTDDYYLEKIFFDHEVFNILETETDFDCMYKDFIIITNDAKMLSKFILVVNIDELKMLCDMPEFDERNIRINKNYFESYNKDVFEYFMKIKRNEIISACMAWTPLYLYPYDDPTIRLYDKSYIGWVENKEFMYFKTPSRYRKNNSSEEIFYIDDIKRADIQKIKELINVNILDIGIDDNQSDNWELENGLLRYYDEESCKRLYITQELLNLLRENNGLEFEIITKLDKNHYIEYYVAGIYIEEEDD